MKYTTILVDLDGTIFDFRKSEEIALQVCLKKFQYPFDDKLYKKYISINRDLWRKFENDEISKTEVLVGRFELLFKSLNYDIEPSIFNRKYQNELSNSYNLIDGARDILKYLYPKYKLYVVTNGLIKTQMLRLKKTGVISYFSDIFISEAIGCQKPNKEFFNYCFDKILNDRQHSIIIGDSLTSDILGGNNAGIDTCWFNPDNEINSTNATVNFEIANLAELKNIL
ncbi:YjjG family noncanonical pyrimidine nucleotidase [Wukongibacter baidiensis]|uniref:YjjG family noncanonical pyrimidine nucleotidase n=1 Tax=Wukongibacter baidiensis TaxID=1723361 RepID=UPI003D7FB1F2